MGFIRRSISQAYEMKNCIIKQEGAAVSAGTVSLIIQQKTLRLDTGITYPDQLILLRLSFCQTVSRQH
jgi:hypothetical protein